MKELWIAIPDSVVCEQKGGREKTEKLGGIARACAIFGVKRIFVYRDPEGKYDEDRNLILLVLRYLETPQYLRKKLFPITKELSYAGILPPLKIPSHKQKISLRDIKDGEIREAVLEEVKGKLYADAGLDALIPFRGKGRPGERVTVEIKGKYPNLYCIEINKEEIGSYWGYEVKGVDVLEKLLTSTRADFTILTSRYGRTISSIWKEFCRNVARSKRVLVVFGSPKRGLLEMLSKDWIKRHDFQLINMIPGQKVETVRTEEALIVTLAIINLAKRIG